MNRGFCLASPDSSVLISLRGFRKVYQKDLSLLVVRTYATVSSLELTKREIVILMHLTAPLSSELLPRIRRSNSRWLKKSEGVGF